MRHPEFRFPALFTVQVPTETRSAPVLTLEPGCEVSGVVVTRSGNAVAGASVRVFETFMEFEQQTTYTDRNGRFEFHNIMPGRRRILVQAQHLGAAWTEIVASPARAVQNQFVLEPGDSVGGKVVDKTGKPVAGVSVGCGVRFSTMRVNVSTLALNTWTLTAEDGSFRLGPLPPGELRLTALLESLRLAGDAVVDGNRADVVITVAEEAPESP